MTSRLKALLYVLACVCPTSGALATDEIFDFFEAEAQVITASRQPQLQRRAPATVYVVTAKDIETSGAQTLWDVLRTVPGVDVLIARTYQGEVSIRGLNKLINNRTLVLLDGKTVLNGFFDFVTWEGIPVSLSDLDRIEVVAGPASALYGPNAISGVINLITKSPEQQPGSTVRYTAGERQTHLGSLAYNKRQGAAAYGVSLGFGTGNRFSDPGKQSSKVLKAHATAAYQPAEKTRLRLSGGLADYKTRFAVGTVGLTWNDGFDGFLRADAHHRGLHMRSYWNRGRTDLQLTRFFDTARFDYNTYDMAVEHTLALPFDNVLTGGVGFRRNTTRSDLFDPMRTRQDLWALFYENTWQPAPPWTVLTGGRIDRHPLTGWTFSPRISVVFAPRPAHTFRISAGTAFRNPTLTENFLQFDWRLFNTGTLLPNPPFTHADLSFRNNPDLTPERLRQIEVAYAGRFKTLHITAVGFHYRLKNQVFPTPLTLTAAQPPVLALETSFVNAGEVRAWGGEWRAEIALSKAVHTFANYAYQKFTGQKDPFVSQNGGPRHKFNAGLRVQSRGATGSLQVHRTSATAWNRTINTGQSINYGPVSDYVLLNARLAYDFPNHLSISLQAFNLLDHAHFEILPAQNDLLPGQNGVEVRRRMTGTLAYAF